MRRLLAAAALTVAAAGAGVGPAHATLAFVKGAWQGKPVVWVAADDGSGAIAFARGGFSPQVSPDGTQVAYVIGSRTAVLKVKPVAGGVARTVARSVWNYDAIHWSPDGTRLSVVTGRELGPYSLSVVDVASGAARRVARGYFSGVSFAPDGSGLAFARAFSNAYPPKANLYVTGVDGGSVHRLTSDGNAASPVWGPLRIAFDRARRASRRGDYDKLDIYTVAPDGSDLKRMTRTSAPFLLSGLQPLAWSADGGRLAAQYSGQDTSEAWRVNPATGAAADATGGFDGIVGWGLSRDGSALLATTGYFDNPRADVVAVAWDGGAQTVLARDATQPSWNR